MDDITQFTMDFMKGFPVEYAEVRYQADQKETIILKNGVAEASSINEERGIGVRLIVQKSLGFASTNYLTKQSAKLTVKKAFKLAQASARLLHRGVSIERCELGEAKVEVKPHIEFGNVDLESRVDLLKNADSQAQEAASEAHVEMPNRMLTLDTWTTVKNIITSDGANIRSMTPRATLFTIMTAFQQQAGIAQRTFDLGGTGGWEVVKGWNLPELFKEEGHALSQIILKAKKTLKGTMDLVLGPEVVGLVCHESSGHPGEADRILGREAAQAGETYLKADSLGLCVGSSHVNVVDDPTVKGSFGYYEYDEEGVKAKKRILIKNGIINEYLQNRETASIFGVPSNAASRAVAYNREPIVRMANTFLEPGDYSEEELFEGVKKGVYIKNFMEWNIDDRRFNQRYVGLEAYQVENGELKERVKTLILEVTTIGLWLAVDAIGKDIAFQAAYCGKGDPMQAIPVWVGGPHARLRNIKLGGA